MSAMRIKGVCLKYDIVDQYGVLVRRQAIYQIDKLVPVFRSMNSTFQVGVAHIRFEEGTGLVYTANLDGEFPPAKLCPVLRAVKLTLPSKVSKVKRIIEECDILGVFLSRTHLDNVEDWEVLS